MASNPLLSLPSSLTHPSLSYTFVCEVFPLKPAATCVSSLSFALFLGTHASSHDSREPAHPLDVRAPILDLCVSLNLDLYVPDVAGVLKLAGLLGESTFSSSPTCLTVPLKRIKRRMHMSLCPSSFPRGGRRRPRRH
jgi:hypothetical protein